VLKASHDSRVLTEVPAQQNTSDPGIQNGEALDLWPRAIFGPVIHKYDLVRNSEPAQGAREPFM
jgi:hypothetical protein